VQLYDSPPVDRLLEAPINWIIPASNKEVPLRFAPRFAFLLAFFAAFLRVAAAQQAPPPESSSKNPGELTAPPSPIVAGQPGQSYKASLETSETLFSMFAALQACLPKETGAELPLRSAMVREVEQAVAASAPAQTLQQSLCRFYRDHVQGDAAHTLAQYVSLGLYLGVPPGFSPVIREADFPPDAAYVLGVVPLLQRFYTTAGLQAIWQKHQPDYDAMVGQFHGPVADMIMQTDLYLKLQFSGYLGRRFIVFLEPLAPPGTINARNYGDDYLMVVSPQQEGLPMIALRHTYLHYVLDPFALKRGTSLKKLDPVLLALGPAPMDESFKIDASLLVTECLIRAIEARALPGKGKEASHEREQMVDSATREGFILTPYFYDTLGKFEKDPAGLKDEYANWVYNIDVAREKKRAEETDFAKVASPELLRAPRQQKVALLDLAEQRLAARDAAGAAALAREALKSKDENPAQAMFVLARAAALGGDMQGAQVYFEQTLQLAREPRLAAWAHIYLGRIYDLREQRDAAVAQYRAALAAGDITPDTKSAAENGLARPYAPPVAQQENR